MKNGKEFLLTDTVGFIQKLPTTLVRKIPLLQLILLWVVYNWYLVLFFDIIYGKKFTRCHFFCSLQVAAFRATLEEISESSLLVHVIDIRLYISRSSRSHFIYREKEFKRTRQLLVLIYNISHQLFSWIAVTPWPSNR